jgi:hypothetical protein
MGYALESCYQKFGEILWGWSLHWIKGRCDWSILGSDAVVLNSGMSLVLVDTAGSMDSVRIAELLREKMVRHAAH